MSGCFVSSPLTHTSLFLLLLVGFLTNLSVISSLSTPVNYYIQTLDGFYNTLDKVVEAKNAYMLSPTGLCLGLNGDVFVSDAERHVVFRIFNTMSSVEVYAGYVTNGYNGDGLKAVGTLLNTPTAISVNPVNGDLYIADSLNNRIRIVSNRTRTTSIAHMFNNPRGVYVSVNGFVYISDTDNNLIKKYEISTSQISVIGGGGYLNGDYDGVDAKLLKLQSPKNIFVVSNGNKDIVYFTDAERLKSIDENGKYRIVDGGVAQSNLYGVYVSNGGEIYASSQSNNFVQMKLVNSAETQIFVGGSEGYGGDNQLYNSPNISFYEPSSLIVTQNTLIVADKSNRCIRKIDLQTKMVSTLSGGIVNHPNGEDISPLQMYSGGDINFPFYHKNELYFVEKLWFLRKVSNGKMKTVLGCHRDYPIKYSAGIPQRIYLPITTVFYIGNGDVLLLSEYSIYNFNLETQILTLAFSSSQIYPSLAAIGDSFNNSTIYVRYSNYITAVQKSTIVYYLLPIPTSIVDQIVVFPNLRYPNCNSVFTYSTLLNTLYEYLDFKNGSTTVVTMPIPSSFSFTGFSMNGNNSLFFWNAGQLYDYQLETHSLKKISGLDYYNVSNSAYFVVGYNGENIPIENSALFSPRATRQSSSVIVTNVYHISELSNGKITTIAGLSPISRTLVPGLLMRDSSKKVIYFVDNRTLKKFDETTGKSTSLSTSLFTSITTPFDTPYLTLNLQPSVSRPYGLFSKFDGKIYIKDACRIIRIDPKTVSFEKLIGNACGMFVVGVKGTDSPCPAANTAMTGMTYDETTGDLLFSTASSIFRYNLKTQFISLEFAFSIVGTVISSDGIINNATIPGLIANILYQDGYLYICTSSTIRRIEKLSDGTFYLRTIVGNFIAGYSGDKLPALQSSIDNPSALYVKKNGDIIILDGIGACIVRMYQNQSGLLLDIAGSRSVASKFNGDGFGTYSMFTLFSKQVDYDEGTGEIFLIDSVYIRKVIPYCGENYLYNSWNNTCDAKLSCNGTLAISENVCNGNGQCSDFNVCQCKSGFEGQFCEIQKTQDSTVLIVAIVIPVVAFILILLTVLILIIVLFMCFSKKRKKDFELAKLDTRNVELSETTFLSISSMIISSSAGSSVGSDTANPFSRYANISRIGQGAFGSVYKVTDLKTNKPKAIKTVKFESLTDLNTIMKEASQLSNIKHPNIIKINDYFITNDNLLIIDMDFYELGDLSKLNTDNCREKIVKQILKQMLSALKYVHEEMHIIHRDIKPTNIFIKKLSSDNIEIVLADFGLAKKYQEMSGHSYAGTPLYMSPEVALGSSYSFNTDIFSLGISIYQIMTNDQATSISNLLMGNQAENAIKILTNQMKETAHNEYSEELIQIVLKMLEKDAKQRPSAAQLLSLTYFK